MVNIRQLRGEDARQPRPDPDEDIAEMVRAGNTRAALQALMGRHGKAIYRYCCLELRDATLADDVHQQVFLEAFRDLPRFAGRSTLAVWLLGIARHRVLDAAKKRRRAQAHLDDAAPLDLHEPTGSAADALDDARFLELLAAAVARLEPEVRTAVVMHYSLGMTYEEIGRLCHEKPGTLHARVNRALPVLRRDLEARARRRR